MNAAVGLMDGLGLDGDRCIRVIPRHVYLTIIITTNAISLLHLIVYALSLQYVILLSFQLECDCVIRHFMRNFDMKVIRTRRQ